MFLCYEPLVLSALGDPSQGSKIRVVSGSSAAKSVDKKTAQSRKAAGISPATRNQFIISLRSYVYECCLVELALLNHHSKPTSDKMGDSEADSKGIRMILYWTDFD